MIVCTRPLPNVVSPTIRPRSWSWIAPATISEALALCREVSTTSGQLGEPALALGDVARLVAPRAPAGEDHHLPLLQEEVGHRERLVEQPARVVADVEDQRRGALVQQVPQRLLQLALAVLAVAGAAGGGLVEVLQADVAGVGAGHEVVGHRVQRDLVAEHRELQRLVVVLPHHRDVHRRALGAAQPLHRVVDAHAAGVLALDLADHVAGADAQAVGGRALERRDDGDVPVHRLHGDPEAVVRALLPLLEGGVLLGLQEVRVGIERAQHLADGRGHQLVGLHLSRVALLDRAQDGGVQAQVLGEARGGGERAAAEQPPGERAGGEDRETDRADPSDLHAPVHLSPAHDHSRGPLDGRAGRRRT